VRWIACKQSLLRFKKVVPSEHITDPDEPEKGSIRRSAAISREHFRITGFSRQGHGKAEYQATGQAHPLQDAGIVIGTHEPARGLRAPHPIISRSLASLESRLSDGRSGGMKPGSMCRSTSLPPWGSIMVFFLTVRTSGSVLL
jgi:hypothetical protein